jgi:hypothetical protein
MLQLTVEQVLTEGEHRKKDRLARKQYFKLALQCFSSGDQKIALSVVIQSSHAPGFIEISSVVPQA